MWKKRESGITLLEASIIIVFLCSFIITSWALVEHIQNQRFMEGVLDKHVYNSAVKPFMLNESANMVINQGKMDSYLKDSIEAMKNEIHEKHGKDVNIYIEMSYYEINIDTQTGKIYGRGTQKGRKALGNSGFISGELMSKTDLMALLNKYISSAQVPDGAFLYAIPVLSKITSTNDVLGKSGTAITTNSYEPSVVLVAARAFFKRAKGGPTEFLKEHLNLEPIYSAVKVTPLRGTYDL